MMDLRASGASGEEAPNSARSADGSVKSARGSVRSGSVRSGSVKEESNNGEAHVRMVDPVTHGRMARRTSFLSADEVDRTDWPTTRQRVLDVMESKPFDMVMGLLIIGNLVLILVETNLNAECVTDGDDLCKGPVVVNALNYAFLIIYTIEALARLYAYREWYFFVSWNILDMAVVISGIIDLALSSQMSGFGNLQTLRVFRILRLLRTIRLLTFFPELYEMVRGFGSAMKAMLWGITIIVIMLGLWSLLAVEIVHPKNKAHLHEVHPECREAFGSVQRATLFFFQTLVAGDSWGQCTIPIIKESPWLIIIFAGALVSVQLGFTNLILAVIVEAAARARERDYEHRLKEKKRYERKCLEEWHTVIESLDNDNSGSISMEELKVGFQTQPALSKILGLLDIDWQDLESFFRLMDNDNSGDVSYVEFFNCLRKAHSQDMRMYLMNVKLQVSQISSLVSKQLDIMTQGFEQLTGNAVAEVGMRKSRTKGPILIGEVDAANEKVPRIPIRHGEDVATEIEKMPRAPHHSQPLKTGHLGSNAPFVSHALISRGLDESTESPEVVATPRQTLKEAISIAEGSLHSAFKVGIETLRHELEERLDRLSKSVAQNSKSLEALLVSCGLDESTASPEAPPNEPPRDRLPTAIPNGRMAARRQVSPSSNFDPAGRVPNTAVLGMVRTMYHVFPNSSEGRAQTEPARRPRTPSPSRHG